MAVKSIKVGGWVGLIGIVMTAWTGDGSAVEVSRTQPMKLAAMEGLWKGGHNQEIIAFGILNPEKTIHNDVDPYLFKIGLPSGLSILARHDADAFVPGIDDIIAGRDFTPNGVPVNTVSYAERIISGRASHDALRTLSVTDPGSVENMMAASVLSQTFPYFGYGYLNNPEEAVPPVGLTFYSFHIMVMAGGYLMLFMIVMLVIVYKRRQLFDKKWLLWICMLTIPVVWICSECGWICAEVGRQPWIIQDLMPTRAAISDIETSSVQLTFWMFAIVFTLLLAAEASIMIKQIGKEAKKDEPIKE